MTAAIAIADPWPEHQPIEEVRPASDVPADPSAAAVAGIGIHSPLAVVLALDGLRPILGDPIASAFVRVLDALAQTDVRVVLVSGEAAPAARRLHAAIPRTWWLDRNLGWCDGTGARPVLRGATSLADAIPLIRGEIVGVHAIAIGADEALFQKLSTNDCGLAIGSTALLRRDRVTFLPGALSLRATLWSLVGRRS